MLDLCRDCVVVVCQLVRAALKVLHFFDNPKPKNCFKLHLRVVYSLVVLRKRIQPFAESLCPLFSLDLNFSGECLHLRKLFRPLAFFHSEHLQIECFLVGLFEECHQESRSAQDLRFEHCIQKALVLDFAACDLFRVERLGRGRRQWWDDCLGEAAKQVHPQGFEVFVQALNLPLIGVSFDCQH